MVFLPIRHECGGATPKTSDAAIHDPAGQAPTFFLFISRGLTAEWIIHVLSDSLSLDCHAIGNDLPGDHDELGFVRLNRTCGCSTVAWCQLGNGLRIVNRGTGYSPGWHMLLMMMMMMTLCVGDNKNWHNTLAVTVLEMVILSFLSSILVICDEIYIGSF